MRIVFLIIAINILLVLPKKIVELNNESFNRIVELNKYHKNKKLLIIFYSKNCYNCEEAINIISNEIIERYKYDDKIDFGMIDCDLRENIWLNIRFNISRVPYIILIKGNYFYELNSNYDKYELDYFINDIKEKKDLIQLPDDIDIFKKRIIILNHTINYFRDYFQYYFNININKNIIIFILILLLIVLIWIIKYIIEYFCCKIVFCRICRKTEGKKVIITQVYEDLSGISDNVSGSKLESEEEDNNSMHTSELSDSLFNQEIEEIQVIKKYKQKIE